MYVWIDQWRNFLVLLMITVLRVKSFWFSYR